MPRFNMLHGLLIFFLLGAVITLVAMILVRAEPTEISSMLFGYFLSALVVFALWYACSKLRGDDDDDDDQTEPLNRSAPREDTPGEPLLPRPSSQFPSTPDVRITDDDDRFDNRPGSWPATPSHGTRPRRRQQPPQDSRPTQLLPPANLSPEQSRRHPGTPDEVHPAPLAVPYQPARPLRPAQPDQPIPPSLPVSPRAQLNPPGEAGRPRATFFFNRVSVQVHAEQGEEDLIELPPMEENSSNHQDAPVYQQERSSQNELNPQPAQLEPAQLDKPNPQTIRQRTEGNESSPQTARQNRSLQNSPTRRSPRLNPATQQRPNSHPSQQATYHPHNSVQPHEEELVYAGWEQQAKERTNEAVVTVFDDGRENP